MAQKIIVPTGLHLVLGDLVNIWYPIWVNNVSC